MSAPALEQDSEGSVENPFGSDVDVTGIEDPTEGEIDEWATLDTPTDEEDSAVTASSLPTGTDHVANAVEALEAKAAQEQEKAKDFGGSSVQRSSGSGSSLSGSSKRWGKPIMAPTGVFEPDAKSSEPPPGLPTGADKGKNKKASNKAATASIAAAAAPNVLPEPAATAQPAAPGAKAPDEVADAEASAIATDTATPAVTAAVVPPPPTTPPAVAQPVILAAAQMNFVSPFNPVLASQPIQPAAPAAPVEITPASPPPPPTTKPNQQDDEDDEDDYFDESHLQEREGAPGSWSGWGTGWGLGALGRNLKEVAVGAVRDVRELSESFQQALADVGGDDDDGGADLTPKVKAADRGAASTSAAAAAATVPTAAPEPEGVPSRAASGPAEEEDPELEVGLQAIDQQVEQLATGATKVLSSLWGGLTGVAKKVEAATKEMAQELVLSVQDDVRGVTQMGSQLAIRAEKGLESVGRTALGIFEGVTGGANVWGEGADQRAADIGHDPETFEDFFYIYGGEQLAEEVDEVASEAARMCNKSRSKLEVPQQESLDAVMASLGAYFGDLEEPSQPATDSPSSVKLEPLDESSAEAAEKLHEMYSPINYLCQDSLSKADVYLMQMVELAQAPEDVPAAPKKSEDEEADDLAGPSGYEDYEEEPKTVSSVLHTLQGHASKRVAEVCTAQLQLLLNYGASLASPARTGRYADDGIPWPGSSLQQAGLLHQEATKMVADLRQVTAAYTQALQRFGEEQVAASRPVPEAVEGHIASVLKTLESQAGAGVGRVQAGFRGLLYAVLLRALVTDVAPGIEEEVADGDD